MTGWRYCFGYTLEWLALASFIIILAIAPIALGGLSNWSLLLIRVAILTSAALWLLSSAILARILLPKTILLSIITAYFGVVLLSTFTSEYTYASVQQTLNIGTYLLGFFLASGLVTTQIRQKILIAILYLSALVMGSYGLMQFWGIELEFFSRLSESRLSSFYYNSNHYSGYLALITSFTIGFFFYAKKIWLKILFLLLAILLFFNLALTFSWGFLATLIAVSGLFFIWAWQHIKIKTLFLTFVAIIVIGVGGMIALVSLTPQLKQGNLQERTVEFFDRYVSFSFLVRVDIAKSTWQIVKEQPWLGVGPGNFIYTFTKYRPEKIEDSRGETLHKFMNYAHNDYNQVASEMGFLGLITFITFWLCVLLLPSKLHHKSLRYGILVGLVALLLHGISDGNLTIVPASTLLAYSFAGVLHRKVLNN